MLPLSFLTPFAGNSIIRSVRRTSVRGRGFTMIELLVVISVLGILMAFMVPRMVAIITRNTKKAGTQQELMILREAIVGDANLVVDGQYVKPGFRNDVGRYPYHLIELATRNPFEGIYANILYVGKETIPPYDFINRRGWNGPYVAEDGNFGYLYDSWDIPYQFYIQNNETLGLQSAGPDNVFWGQPGSVTNDDIVVRF